MHFTQSWYFHATHVHIINVSRQTIGVMLLILFALYKEHLWYHLCIKSEIT